MAQDDQARGRVDAALARFPEAATLAAIKMATDAGYSAVASHRLRGDRGQNHCRFGSCNACTADQNRLPLPLRSRCEVQPPAGNRTGAGPRFDLRRATSVPSAVIREVVRFFGHTYFLVSNHLITHRQTSLAVGRIPLLDTR